MVNFKAKSASNIFEVKINDNDLTENVNKPDDMIQEKSGKIEHCARSAASQIIHDCSV